jgi:hypothetical protein
LHQCCFSNPDILPETHLGGSPRVESSSQLKKLFDFVQTMPKWRAICWLGEEELALRILTHSRLLLSSENKRQIHLTISARFIFLLPKTPRPPWSLGLQMSAHLIRGISFWFPDLPRKICSCVCLNQRELHQQTEIAPWNVLGGLNVLALNNNSNVALI